MTKKVLILFGAGASNGSGGILDPPPLGRDLFTRLSNQFPNSWGKLSEKYRSKFSENFEKGMEMFYNEVDDYTQYLKDMTIFFSKFKIDYFKENLYWILISKYIHPLESTELMLSTINYDCLIELAALQFNPNITYWGKNKGIKILKIHGSCNFIKSNVRGRDIVDDCRINYYNVSKYDTIYFNIGLEYKIVDIDIVEIKNNHIIFSKYDLIIISNNGVVKLTNFPIDGISINSVIVYTCK